MLDYCTKSVCFVFMAPLNKTKLGNGWRTLQTYWKADVVLTGERGRFHRALLKVSIGSVWQVEYHLVTGRLFEADLAASYLQVCQPVCSSVTLCANCLNDDDVVALKRRRSVVKRPTKEGWGGRRGGKGWIAQLIHAEELKPKLLTSSRSCNFGLSFSCSESLLFIWIK